MLTDLALPRPVVRRYRDPMEPTDDQLARARQLYDDCAPKLRELEEILNVEDVPEIAETQANRALWSVSEALDAINELNGRLDFYGWAR